MRIINTIIGVPLGYLMWLCFSLLNNYGLAIILFTILTKVILFPLSVWVQKNSIKMIQIQPELNMLTASCVGDKNALSDKQVALYKKNKYHPVAGIIPMLIQIPIILGLIMVVYSPLQHLLHLDSGLIDAFVKVANTFRPGLDYSTEQLAVIDLIHEGNAAAFLGVNVPNVDVAGAVSTIQNMDLSFLGLNLSTFPQIAHFSIYWIFPALSGISALILCLVQNKENVLQKEQGFWGKWGMTIFLVAFSTYFAFIVPAAIGLYWIVGNILATVMVYILNAIYNPKKYIDYPALEKSKIALAKAKEIEKTLKLTPEQKARAKADYKRFSQGELFSKKIIVYSEKSGFYKYFENILDQFTKKSDVLVHYITSDPNDAIFKSENKKIIPYFIDNNHLIPLFMKIDSDIVVMTTPNLQTYYLKRSLVRKDVEYIYVPHDPVSIHMGVAPGAYDHFDTVFCVGPQQMKELRAEEKVYHTKEKKLVEGGYGLLDNLIASYDVADKQENEIKKILIAPSWQEDNIMDSCIDDLVEALVGKGYDVTIRPHPEYVKRFAVNLETIIDRFRDKFDDHFRIETDFSSNVTIFSADLVISDWSGIALEFAYTTLRPAIFINTKRKVLNPDYEKVGITPLEVWLRDEIGVSVDPKNVSDIRSVVDKLLSSRDEYEEKIRTIRNENVFNIGHSGEVIADYLIDDLNNRGEPQF